MPRLGFFIGQEARLPFDFDQALALAADRKVLIVAPTLDRYARVDDVRTQVRRAGFTTVTLETPAGFNSFKRPLQERVFDWLQSMP
jgi:hypothetical protein